MKKRKSIRLAVSMIFFALHCIKHDALVRLAKVLTGAHVWQRFALFNAREALAKACVCCRARLRRARSKSE